MQRFSCPLCGTSAYFHNLTCVCGAHLAYDPRSQAVVTDAPFCINRARIDCNWTAPRQGAYCMSCAMSQVVPVLNVGDNLRLLARAERGKRWVLANLAQWGWFTQADTGARPRFLMLSEHTGGRTQRVVMGHAGGAITINVTEADELIRLKRQLDLGEQYRSMVGHFRHEMAHFLFDRLTALPGFLSAFRDIFGDERQPYGEALRRYYADLPDPGEDHITRYAAAHPHEDWAESVAHLLHMVDFTDSFVSTGLTMAGVPDGYLPYREHDTARLLGIASEVAIAVNDINRALDNGDLYPFVLTGPVRAKLTFAHHWLRSAHGAAAAACAERHSA